MFSYRHGFHAGNHADVLKHLALIACIRLLQKKDVGLMYVDTHAGGGFYDLQDTFATTSKEAERGIYRLLQADNTTFPSAIKDYLDLLFQIPGNSANSLRHYPGSPYIFFSMMRIQDKLRLFELHTSEQPAIKELFQELNPGPKRNRFDIQIENRDGFKGLKAYLPPPSRRGLALIDPSYEDKADYFHVLETIEDAIKRFATGVYMIWYPILSRYESQDLPVKLSKLCAEKKLSWVQAELQVHSGLLEKGLSGSGLFIINAPWQLDEKLLEALPILKECLQEQDEGSYLIKSSDSN